MYKCEDKKNISTILLMYVKYSFGRSYKIKVKLAALGEKQSGCWRRKAEKEAEF